MNSNASRCDHQRIDDFLNSDHVGLEDAQLVSHLDFCHDCRVYLERHAADAQSWNQAAELLRQTEFDLAGSIECSAAAMDFPKFNVPMAIQSVLNSLAPSDDPLRLGRLGGYEISGVVGVGGMGVVLKAIDPALDRVVAIKVMAPHLASHATARKRFAREAKAAAAVLHPNVIPIHSVSSEEATPYLVMAYIRGGSLQKRLDREGALATVEILRIGSQVAAGLAAAHDQGLVHRDIKPENILLEEGVERVTLTDFGLARTVDDASVTQQGTIAGTPQYMSPEQARGESVDQASDLFSLGSVLYTLCTGRVPFRAESSHGVMRKIIDEEPVPIRELNPEIPVWLCGIIARLMAKNKADRFTSAKDVHRLLEACLSHVQQPTIVQLPESLQAVSRSRPRLMFRLLIGFCAMTTICVLLLWVTGGLGLLVQEPPSSQTEPAAQESTTDARKADPKQQPQAEPLTWKSLLGEEAPEDYPMDPLSLIDGLDKSRGSWIFAGTLHGDGEDVAFEADMQIQGGFKNLIALGRMPGWQITLQWPRQHPEQAWKLALISAPEPKGIKWMLVSMYSRDGETPAPGERQFFDGVWNAETRTLTWTPKVPPLPGNQTHAKPSPDQQPIGREFQMIVKENGELQIRNFRPSESLQVSGQAAARVGEPYVDQDLNRMLLPNGYKVFFASASEVLLVDEKGGGVAGARVEKIGCQGNVIYGLITQREGVKKPEDTLGYFWLDSTTGRIVKGMELGAWRDALKAAGVEEPRLLRPEQVGPKH
jgi:serine/threonine protein kinase